VCDHAAEIFEPWGSNTESAVMRVARQYMASTTLSEPLAWQKSTLLQGDVAKAVAELKEGEGWSGKKLFGEGGSGKKLFGEGEKKLLRLVDSKTSTTGVLMTTYAPER
jgi:hypothetical protein